MSLTFDVNGLLPVGDHAMRIADLRSSVLVTGPRDRDPNWDTAWRAHLVDQLSVLCVHLREVGDSAPETSTATSSATTKPFGVTCFPGLWLAISPGISDSADRTGMAR